MIERDHVMKLRAADESPISSGEMAAWTYVVNRATARIRKLEAALRLIADAKDVRGCDEIARQALAPTPDRTAEHE